MQHQDESVEHLASPGADTLINPDKELTARKGSLERGTSEVKENNKPGDQVERLRGIPARHMNAARKALRGDPPGPSEDITVKLKWGSWALNARPRRYEPSRSVWFAGCTAIRIAFELVVFRLQAI